MSNETKNDDVNPITEFTEKMISAPCFALTGVIAMYITFNEYTAQGNMPTTFLSWLLFIATILFYGVCILIGLFLVYIVGFIFLGGIAPNIDLKYVNIVLTIVIMIGAYYFMYKFFMR